MLDRKTDIRMMKLANDEVGERIRIRGKTREMKLRSGRVGRWLDHGVKA